MNYSNYSHALLTELRVELDLGVVCLREFGSCVCNACKQHRNDR